MATLTGFKRVNDSSQKTPNGSSNPTFVFDDIDVNEQRDQKNTDQSRTEGAKSKEPEASTFTDNKENNLSQTKRMNSTTRDRSNETNDTGTVNGRQNQQVVADADQTPSESINSQSSNLQNNDHSRGLNRSLSANDAIADQAKKDTQNPSANNSLAPSSHSGDGGDNVSVSMLAIDCTNAGKSPRQPRRSPLMALFRGKPRESARRLYTDEDQFEIEWADLSLEIQKKWYQNFNLSNLCASKQDVDSKYKSSEKPTKRILNNVDGRIKSGEITAVLGPSGAGKTSLLNSLFGKYRSAIQGTVKVTGAPSKKHLTVCTIPQQDYLIGYLTTEESLWFASRLKNCEDDFNHDRNIERVIELLGLQRCRHTRINKLSGGQYKRVSIAQEMLSSPDILVLDEPTSGLDSLTCYRTVKVLRDLVEASKAHNLVNPMSIILTIHQPHREVLDLFHSVYVMAVGGYTLYQGSPGEMEDFINKHSGANMPCEGYNPASYMVELASEEYGKKPVLALVQEQRNRFVESTKYKYKFGASPLIGRRGKEREQNELGSWYKGNNDEKKVDSSIALYQIDGNDGKFVDINLEDGAKTNDWSPAVKDIDSRIMTPRSGKNSDGVFWRHVYLMSKRCFYSNTRDPLLFTMRVLAHIFIPLVVAVIYGPKMGVPNGCPFYMPEINLFDYAKTGLDEIRDKHDAIRIQFQNVGLHFMVYYAFGLCMLAFTAISFPLIMHVLIKEIRNGWYSLGTFILGKMISELPLAIILPPISVGIIYIMTGQPSSYLQWRYLVQSLILILIIMIAEAKGLIFGAICMNSMQTAVFAASVSTVPFILLSGFLIRIYEVPYVLQHLSVFSYFKHSVEALIITRYGYGMCPCDPSQIPPGGTPKIIGLSPQIMSLTDYYLSTAYNGPESEGTSEATTEINIPGNNRSISRIIEATTALPADVITTTEAATTLATTLRARRWAIEEESTTTLGPEVEAGTETEPSTGEAKQAKKGSFFDKLATLLTRANAFGFSIETCDDVQPFTMKDMELKDDKLPALIGYLFLYIVILKFVSYFIVEICVKLKL